MKKILLLFSFIGCWCCCQAQIYLQMEKYGSHKVIRFETGDQLTFKLKGKDQNYRTEYIEQIIPKENLLVFTNGMTKVDEIDRIRSFKSTGMSKTASASLYIFAGSWVGYSLIDALFDNPLTLSAAIIPASAAVIGFLVRQIFKHRTYKFNKGKRRLRLLDLRVNPMP